MSIVAAAIGIGLLIPAVTAEASTLREILESIERNNLELRSGAIANEASRLERSSENRPGETGAEFSWQHGADGSPITELILSQEFDFPTLYSARRKSGELRSREEEVALSGRKRVLLSEAAKKCIELAMCRCLDTLFSGRADMRMRVIRDMEEQVQEGNTTRVDLNILRLEQLDLAGEIAENRATIERLCREILSMNANHPLDLSKIELPRITPSIPDSLDLAGLLAASPDVLVARAGEETSLQEIAESRQGWAPSLSLGYRMNTEGKDVIPGFTVGLGFNLFSTGIKVKTARRRNLQAALETENARIAAENELSALLEEMRQTHRAMELYDEPLMKETQELLDISLSEGKMVFPDYCEESDKIFSRRAELIRLQAKYMMLAAELYK